VIGDFRDGDFGNQTIRKLKILEIEDFGIWRFWRVVILD
jgi:hypothetical protein